MQSSSDKKSSIQQLIFSQKILPLFYTDDEQVSINIFKALYEAGIRTVEYTNRGESALNNFKTLKRICEDELTEMQLGIGTIKTSDEAKAFVDAGADYLISPGIVKAAFEVADEHGILYIPGCMTATELIEAESLGATLIKIFPGNVLGPGFISAVKELFPRLRFVVTGGVEPEEANLTNWFKAGVAAVGMGSKLITKEILESKNYTKLTSLTQEALRKVQSL